MRDSKLNFAWLLAVGFTLFAATSITAQQTTLDGFNKTKRPSASRRQKSPQRQLAQRIATSDQESDKTKAPTAKPDDKAAKPAEKSPVSKARRTELMAFVKSNHPELQPLLNQLQKKRPKQFESALRTLDRKVKYLQALEKKSPNRYQRELAHWGVKSRIQLLSAEMAIKKSDKEKNSIRKKIRSLFERQHELQKEQLTASLEAAKKKYEKLAARQKELEENRDAEIARKLKEIDKTSERVSAERKKNQKQPVKKENANPEKKAESAPKKTTPPVNEKPAAKPAKETKAQQPPASLKD